MHGISRGRGLAIAGLGLAGWIALSAAPAEAQVQKPPPFCGTGLYCKGGPFPGASACRQQRPGEPVVHCCPAGHRFVNGRCAPKPPTCGTGLYCTANDNRIPGSSPCTQNRSDENIVNCCPAGQKIENGKCAAPMTGRRAQIAQLYRDILDREPDAPGLDHWTSSSMSLAQVRVAFAKSPEGRSKINGLYKKWLCRDAEPAGMEHWTNVLGATHVFDKVSDLIAASTEAQQKKKGGWYKDGVCWKKP